MSLRDNLDDELKTAVDSVQQLVQELKEVQGDKAKQVEARYRLGAQTNENEIVKSELQGISSDVQVYKLIGPVLVAQDTEDAKTIIQKRLEFIEKETAKCDQSIHEIDKKEQLIRQKIGAIHDKMEEKKKESVTS